MDVKTFIDRYRTAFSENAELPIAFWYSDDLSGELEKTQGCLFKAFPLVRSGETVSMNAETIGCGGGKFYTGFSSMGEHIANFVSKKERYKSTPESVLSHIADMEVSRCEKKYIHFARIDRLDSFSAVEGIIFLATPDILTGLCSWVFFDNDSTEAVATLFNSGCSATITRTTNENRRGGSRTFLGLFDPSVRPFFESNLLSLSIPMSRFREMYDTMLESCLFDTPAWSKVKDRIANR